MDWFLYDIGLCHERVNPDQVTYKITKMRMKMKASSFEKILLKCAKQN